MSKPREYLMDAYEVVQGLGIRKCRVWNYVYCNNFHYHESLQAARATIRQKPRVRLSDVQRKGGP